MSKCELFSCPVTLSRAGLSRVEAGIRGGQVPQGWAT